MANIDATITGVQLLHASPIGVGARKVFLLMLSFAAYTGSGDTSRALACNTAIQNAQRNGKTVTVRAAASGPAGFDTAGQAVYVDTSISISGGDLTFDLATLDGTELTTATASKGVGLIVVVDES